MLHAIVTAITTMLASTIVLRIGGHGAAPEATDVVLGGLVIAASQIIAVRLLGHQPPPV